MRLAFNLFVVGTTTIFASSSYSQDTKLNLSLENVRIKDLLQEIKKQSDFSFWYNNNELNDNDRVTLEVKDQTIDKILTIALKDKDLAFEIKDRFILIYRPDFAKTSTARQQVKISGVITDAATGEVLPGVNIMIDGSNKGVTSDINGKYSIEVSGSGVVLVFSYIGYLTEKIVVGVQSIIDVTLAMDIKKLDEVVVVGYGTMRKKDVTSSITTVNSEEFNQGAHTDLMQLVQGKVPGLNITKDGNPSGKTATILRGQSTLRTGDAQEPLYVVDGIPGGIFQLDDVVSVDVLRDASAAAIYGSRAANGVIIITTKRGEENNSRISYNAYMGIETISNKIDMMSADQYRTFLSDNSLILDPEDEDNVNTDWLKECTQTGVSMNHNVSLGGGNSKTTYFGSATYKKVDGIVKETGVKSLSFMLNVQQKAIKDRLKLGLTLTSTLSDHKLLPVNPSDLNGDPDEFLLNMVNYLPTESVKQEDGSFSENMHTSSYNPMALLRQNSDDRRDKDFLGNLTLQYNILKGLDLDMNVSYKNSGEARSIYYGKETRLATGYNGLAIRNQYENQTKLLEYYLTYTKTLKQHDIKLMGGYSWQEDRSGDGFQSSNYGFVSDETGSDNLYLGSGNDNVMYGTTAVLTLRMISFFGRLNYAYKAKYLLQATVRRDGSSAFGSNNRWGTFPSASLGWRITEEPFMKSQHIFDNLKLRATWGISGNSLGFDPLISKLRYGKSGAFYYNEDYVSAITPTQNANNNLKWESTMMGNIGLDFSVFKGRLSGTVEYYKKITKDLIWSYSVSATEYYVPSLTANVGEMENKGFEVSINAIPVRTKNISWTTTFNISSNKNVINSLSNGDFQLDYQHMATSIGEHGQTGNFAQILEEGRPIGQFYLWRYAGRGEDGISQFYAEDGSLITKPGSEDHFYAGSAQPKATGGWNNLITYRNLSLDFMFRGVFGNKILNATRADLNYPTSAILYNLPVEALNQPINDTGASYVSSRYVEKGDYVRLDNITLSYSFDLKTPLIKRLRVYSTANNVFVITGYKGMDPEVYMGGITPGIDNKNFYPKTRTFLFGVNVDF